MAGPVWSLRFQIVISLWYESSHGQVTAKPFFFANLTKDR